MKNSNRGLIWILGEEKNIMKENQYSNDGPNFPNSIEP